MINYLPSANCLSAVSSLNERPSSGPLKARIRADSDSLSRRTHLYCFSFALKFKTMSKWIFLGKPTTKVSKLICYMSEYLRAIWYLNDQYSRSSMQYSLPISPRFRLFEYFWNCIVFAPTDNTVWQTIQKSIILKTSYFDLMVITLIKLDIFKGRSAH